MSGAPRVASAFLVAEGPPGPEGWALLPEVRPEDLGGKDARFAKIDRAAKLLALGARRALEGRTIDPARTGVVLASLTGCLAADERFEATRGRPEGASPALFPATLATSPAAELSIRLGLQGPIFSVRAGVATALALAARAVLRGDAQAVLACGLEVAARGASALLGHGGPFRESVSVILVDGSCAPSVPLTSTLDVPRGELLANEQLQAVVETLNSRR